MVFSFTPPFKTPILSGSFLSKAWETFFRELVARQEIIVNPFQTNGSLTVFTLSVYPKDEKHTMVFVNGLYIPKNKWDGGTSKWVPNYSIDKNKITFTTAPAAGWLEVTTYGR